jgi:hypothetical protein
MKKTDLKKELPFYKAKREPEIVTIPQLQYLMIDGKGDPNTSEEYRLAVEALFSVSYTLKFMVKKGDAGVDYGVMPLEGLWWSEDMSNFTADKKEGWLWTSMILQPEFITEKMFREAKEKVAAKKELPALEKIRFEEFDEGLCVQVLHIGPFSAEGPVIHAMHEFAEQSGYKLRGKHHEIYLSDFRKAAPERLKTILRQPVG